MRVRSPLLFFAGSMLVSSTSFADATVMIAVPSNPTTPQINVGDPAAVSAVLTAEALNPDISVGSSAEGAADLTAGTLRCYSYGALKTDGTDFPSCSISLGDTITFAGPGTTVQVTMTLSVDGSWTLTSASDASVCNQYVFASLQFGAAASPKSGGAQFYHTIDPNNGGNQYTDDGLPADAGITSVSAPASPPNAVTTITYVATIGAPIDVYATLHVDGAGDVNDSERMDFGNTARLALTMPAGYTFTSTSGNFLTQPGAPGLPLPPDGGVGVHGAPDAGLGGGDGGSSGSKDASIGGGSNDSGASNDGDGGGANGDTSGSSDDGGCNVTSASDGYGIAFAIGALIMVAGRRRRRRR